MVKYSGPALPVFILFNIYVFYLICRRLVIFFNLTSNKWVSKIFSDNKLDIEDDEHYEHSLKRSDIQWTLKECEYY